MNDLTIGGETFRVAVDGDETSPVLLLCHPLGGDHRIWDPQVPELARQFRVVRYDARGHGGSTTAGAPYSVVRLGLDALAVLDALEIEKAHVLGMSMGGAVAQWLMIHAPHRIGRGILANTGATFSSAASWNGRIVAAQTEGMESLCEPTLARWFGEAFLADNAAVVEPIRRTFVGTAPEGYAASCAALRDTDLREGVRQVPHPVLVLAGRHDPSVGAAETDLLAETIPGAALVTLETYHIANLGDPPGFAKTVLQFLTAKTPARRSGGSQPSPRLPVARRPAGRRTAATRGTAPRLAAATPEKKPAADVKTSARKAQPSPRKAQAPTAKPAPRPGRAAAAAKTPAAPKPPAAAARKAAAAKRGVPKPKQAAATKRGRPASAGTSSHAAVSGPRSKVKPAAKVAAKAARRPAAPSQRMRKHPRPKFRPRRRTRAARRRVP